jgi:hypothetical protein
MKKFDDWKNKAQNEASTPANYGKPATTTPTPVGRFAKKFKASAGSAFKRSVLNSEQMKDTSAEGVATHLLGLMSQVVRDKAAADPTFIDKVFDEIKQKIGLVKSTTKAGL